MKHKLFFSHENLVKGTKMKVVFESLKERLYQMKDSETMEDCRVSEKWEIEISHQKRSSNTKCRDNIFIFAVLFYLSYSMILKMKCYDGEVGGFGWRKVLINVCGVLSESWFISDDFTW